MLARLGEGHLRAARLGRPASRSLRVVLRDGGFPRVEGPLDPGTGAGRQPLRNPSRADLLQHVEHLRIGRHAHQLHLDGPVGTRSQFGDPVIHAGLSTIGETILGTVPPGQRQRRVAARLSTLCSSREERL